MDYKNQHWIPRSYLKAWCDPDRQNKIVHLYEKDGKYRSWRPYSRIFSCDDLYTIQNGQNRDVKTEIVFKHIEDAFLKVRRAIERGQPLPSSYKQTLAIYVAAMRNRSPTARDHWQSFRQQVVDVGDQMAKALAKATPAERERMARASRLGASDKSRSMTLDEARAAAAEPFGKWVLRHVSIESRLLEKMSIAILKAPEGIGFITSDNPVVWHDANPPPNGRRRIGLGHSSIEVSMPISPSYCILLDHLGEDGFCDVSQATVDHFNSRTLGHCDECFVARSRSLTVDWIEVGD